MSVPQKSIQPSNKYLPAVLKENASGWIIEYYALHPQNLVLQRKQIRIKRIKQRYRSIREARQHAFDVCETINQKLRGGWSPFFVGEDVRLYEKLSTVLNIFIAESKKEKRENTMRSYQSFVKMLKEWVSVNCKDIYVSLFNRPLAVRYLDYHYNERGVSATTYNNQLKMANAFFNWAREKCYCKENPFERIKPKKKQKKQRTIIPLDVREKIKTYLLKNNPNFLNVCELVFFSLIRPNEIKNLKVKDIDLYEKTVYVPSEIAKNHNARVRALSDELVKRLSAMVRDVPSEYYLFGANLTPAKIRIGNGRFGYHWRKLRTVLKLPSTMQLYSLRDTGIYEMLKSGIDNLTVMQHADHSSLNVTTIYANHIDKNLIEKINQKAPKF